MRVVRERRSWSLCRLGSLRKPTTASKTSRRWLVTAILATRRRPARRPRE